jgi:hypothetical protein
MNINVPVMSTGEKRITGFILSLTCEAISQKRG